MLKIDSWQRAKGNARFWQLNFVGLLGGNKFVCLKVAEVLFTNYLFNAAIRRKRNKKSLYD